MGGEFIIIPLSRYTTIMQDAMTGILAAAQLATQEERRSNVFICTDSEAALTALEYDGKVK